jgi:hypothetical protein
MPRSLVFIVLLVAGAAVAQESPARGAAPLQESSAPGPAPVQESSAPGPAAPQESPPPGAAIVQQNPAPVEILIDPAGPGSKHEESRRVPMPPEGPERDAFLQQFIRVDPRANEAWGAERALSAHDFYTRVGRPDLVARADERTRQRVWLFAGAGLTAIAGVAGGAVVLSNVQDLNDPACFVAGNTSYNECVDRANKTTSIGTGLILLGIGVGVSLFTWACLIPEMVTTPEETVQLATGYNRELALKHGATGARLQIVPALAPGYQGLTARLTF